MSRPFGSDSLQEYSVVEDFTPYTNGSLTPSGSEIGEATPNEEGRLVPRFFPRPTRFVEHTAEATGRKWFEFECIDTDYTHETFVVQEKPSKRKLVVRFVERYGVEAHDLLADKGMAPRLLYCGLLDGGRDTRNEQNSRAQGCIRAYYGSYVGPIRMAVMEYIEGSTLDKILDPLEDTQAQIEEAVKTLHGGQFVFGVPGVSLQFRPGWEGERGALPRTPLEESGLTDGTGQSGVGAYPRGT